MIYNFQITETLQKIISIESDDFESANQQIHEMYGDEIIVLCADDITNLEIKEV